LPPARARVALTLGEARTPVGSIEPGLAERMQRAGLGLCEADGTWQLLDPADASLEGIASWLNANNLGGRWRGELLAVTDEWMRALASVERAAVRVLGLTTFAVHLVAARAGGSVWVQQRAADKATDPGLWDTTMGGQVGAGETTQTALERETFEEAGLEIAQLKGLAPGGRVSVRRPVVEGYMVEHIETFEATVADDVTPINRDGEVQRFECLRVDQLWERLLAEQFTLEAALVLADWLERRARS